MFHARRGLAALAVPLHVRSLTVSVARGLPQGHFQRDAPPHLNQRDGSNGENDPAGKAAAAVGNPTELREKGNGNTHSGIRETELPSNIEEAASILLSEDDSGSAADLAGLDEPLPDEDTVEEVIEATEDEGKMAPVMFELLREGQLVAHEAPVRNVPAPRNAKVARLSHGLPRVLFSPGVHTLRDPRTGVWNFNRVLGKIPPPEKFAFDRLPQYITASEDSELAEMAEGDGLKYFGSTSTLTAALSQIYFTLSGGKSVDTSTLSREFATERQDFTAGAKLPASLSIKLLPNGRYAIDNNKENSISENVLSDYGRILEKLLTANHRDFNRFLLSSPDSAVPEEERNEREAYCYSRGETLLMRSQLDCYDPRLPGNGTFDIKTRASMPIRLDRANYKMNSAYDVSKLSGLTGSFEREFYDLTRSGMLKYSLQARIGQMDGIFVAYHNTVRCFGFQYLPLAEIDRRLFGSTEMANQAFNLSVGLLEQILHTATQMYPNQSINLSLLRKNRKPWQDVNELIACFYPSTWNSTDPLPVRALALKIRNELDGDAVGAEGVVFSDDEGIRRTQSWSVRYSLSVTPDTPEGYSTAQRHLDRSIKLLKGMNGLYIPEGKTVAEMNRLSKLKAIGKLGQLGQKSATSASDDDKDKSARIRWMQPNARITEIREMAKQNGEAYNERRGSWRREARNSTSWQHVDQM